MLSGDRGHPVHARQELWRRIHQFASDTNNTARIFERLRVSFARKPQLRVREYGGHFEHLF